LTHSLLPTSPEAQRQPGFDAFDLATQRLAPWSFARIPRTNIRRDVQASQMEELAANADRADLTSSSF
jgi:predicted amidophosphoribosyltransferase